MAYIRENFALKGNWSNYRERIIIHAKSALAELLDIREFPPTFFLEIDGELQNVLCFEYSYGRTFCNMNHPLSQFIITRQNIIKKLVPGIYQELMYSMASDDADEMIPRVNGCLSRLQALPHEELKVPADVFLKKSDFK